MRIGGLVEIAGEASTNRGDPGNRRNRPQLGPSQPILAKSDELNYQSVEHNRARSLFVKINAR